MAEMASEHNHLAQALWHITCAEARVREQRDLIDRRTERGQDTTVAKTLLNTMQTSLDRMNDHRELIERAITKGRK